MEQEYASIHREMAIIKSYYYFDSDSLQYKKTYRLHRITAATIIIFSILLVLSLFIKVKSNRQEIITDLEKEYVIIDREKLDFSKDNLMQYMIDLNIRYPDIVMAQAILETGNFKSLSFVKYNNLFGMKQSYQRPSTNKGTELGHAFYDTWQDSVIDYAIFEAKYMSNMNRTQYYNFLQTVYAEAENYVDAVKTIVEREKTNNNEQIQPEI